MRNEIKRPEKAGKNESEKIVTQLVVPLLFHILKTETDEANPKTAGELCSDLQRTFFDGEELEESNALPARTISRKLSMLTTMDKDDPNLRNVINALEKTMLGQIRITTARSKAATGKRKKYYYRPVLTVSDLRLLKATIQCCSYLSDAEKNYFLSRLNLYIPHKESDSKGYGTTIDALPERPPYSSATAILDHFHTIYEGLSRKNKLKIVYSKGSKKERIINPYAVFDCNGYPYLLATVIDESEEDVRKNVRHFRVDRMEKVQLYSGGKKGIKKERDELPGHLYPFFSFQKNDLVFNRQKYITTHPNMYKSGDDDKTTLILLCNEDFVSVLKDTFGPSIKVEEIPRAKKKEEEVRVKDRRVTIREVQYDNALRYCMSFPEEILVEYPKKLTKEIKNRLKKCYKLYADKLSL